jgi:hypothetical protein
LRARLANAGASRVLVTYCLNDVRSWASRILAVRIPASQIGAEQGQHGRLEQLVGR